MCGYGLDAQLSRALAFRRHADPLERRHADVPTLGEILD